MSVIVCDELKTTLTQTVNYTTDRRHLIEGVKINIVNYGSPAGTFTVKFKQGVNVLTQGSFDISDIKTNYATTDNYGYFYFPVKFDHAVNILKGTYDIELSASGYTYATSNFLGWVRSFENIFNTRAEELDTFQTNPFNVLIYERKREDLF